MSEYITRETFLSDIQPDSTVILKKRFIKHIPFVVFKNRPVRKSPSTIYSPSPEDYYPFVNSYYTFTEDVDAFARVHHLLDTKSSTECFNIDSHKKEVNEYCEKLARHQYLSLRPICFLILGKPGFGAAEVGKRLSEFWNCVYIDPLVLLEEEIQCGSRAGQCIDFNLRCGRAIGIDILTRLLIKKVQTPDCLNRGFVCCEFPLIPNDLYQEDPISSESAIFTIRDIFDEIIDESIKIADISAQVVVSIAETDSTARESELGDIDDEVVDSTIRMSFGSNFQNEICGKSDISTDLQKQINCIFGIFRKPYILIYIAGKNSDVVAKRNSYYFDIYANANIDLEKINFFYEVGASNEDLVEDLFGNGRNPFSLNPNLRHLVQVPENLSANVSTQLDRYHKELLHIIDYHVITHDVQFYIKLDGRNFLSQMILSINLRLQLLSIQPVLSVQTFSQEQHEDGTIETDFNKLCKQETVGSMFKWVWSSFGTYCPVAMSKTLYITGTIPVHFMNQIYYLSSPEYLKAFIENPRPFLLPPFPRPAPNVFIFGPPNSGKSALARCMGYLLNSKILTLEEMHSMYMEQILEEYREQMKQLAMVEAMQILKAKNAEEAEARKQWIRNWEVEVTDLLKKLMMLRRAERESSIDNITAFPMKIQNEVVSDEEELLLRRLNELNIPRGLPIETYKCILKDSKSLLEYLPEEVKKAAKHASVSILDPFVLDYANSKVNKVGVYDILDKLEHNKFDMFIRNIRICETIGGYQGWIIDGMPTDVSLFQQIAEEFPVFEVIILTSSDRNFLIERFNEGEKYVTNFQDFRDLFLDLNEMGAALRSPLVHITPEQIVTDILNEILDDIYHRSSENYDDCVNNYFEEIENIIKITSTPIIIDINKLSIEELLKNAVHIVKDKYRKRAQVFTEEDRAEEIQQLFSGLVQTTEGEDKIDTDQFISQNRRYGDTLYYCPVTFAQKSVLWRGKDQYAAKFKDRLYFCATEENFNTFLQFPRKYLPQIRAPHVFPPPRICMLGFDKILSTSVAKALAKNLGVRYIAFHELKHQAVNAMSNMSLLVQQDELDVPDALSFEFLEVFLDTLWCQEPYSHIGFVIDKFPNRLAELNFMISKKFIPDVIINIGLSREKNLEIELERKMDEWRLLMENQRKEEIEINEIIVKQWQENRKIRYNELIESKRQDRYSKHVELTSETEVSIDSVVEQQEQDEVKNILNEEWPEPILLKSEENEDDVIEKFTEEIDGQYDTHAAFIEELVQVTDEHLIPLKILDGSRSIDNIIRQAFIIGDGIKFRGFSFFERCYDVTIEMAERLLETGYFYLSTFGRLCPVLHYDGDNNLHMYIAGRINNKIFAVIHRQYIYFIYGRKNYQRFVESPMKFTKQTVDFTLVPMIVAFIGPPKCGKTSLSERFRQDLGFKSITRGQAIRQVLSNRLYSNLREAIELKLRKGNDLNDEEVMSCVQAATGGEFLSQGLVFDGFPNSASEVYELTKLGLVPHLIFDLKIDETSLQQHASYRNGDVLNYSNLFFNNLLKNWQINQNEFRLWCDREYQNLYQINVDRSIWGLFEIAKEVTYSVIFERKFYYNHVKLDWPLRLSYMLVTPLEFLERQSSYQAYCPGCLYYNRKLRNGGSPPDRTGLVQYRMYYYWFCVEHLELFLKKPDIFLPPSNITLPSELPVILRLKDEPESPYQDGFCLVCYQNGFPKKVLNKGKPEWVVAYKNKVYMFDALECLNAFMSMPEQLCNLTINFKDSTNMSGLSYKELPVLGMLEQYIARTVVRAVSHTNIYRPVIPGLSVSQSALVCIGLNLKAYNGKKDDRGKYEAALAVFHKRRTDLLKYLDVMKKYMNPFVYYEEPDNSEIDDDDFMK